MICFPISVLPPSSISTPTQRVGGETRSAKRYKLRGGGQPTAKVEGGGGLQKETKSPSLTRQKPQASPAGVTVFKTSVRKLACQLPALRRKKAVGGAWGVGKVAGPTVANN